MTTRIKQIMPAEPGTRLAYMAYDNEENRLEVNSIPVIGWALIETVESPDTYVTALVNDGSFGILTQEDFDESNFMHSIRVLSPWESVTDEEIVMISKVVLDKYYGEDDTEEN